MPWPLSQDYNEAIQMPRDSFGDPELRGGHAVINALGLPMPRSGNFADVYEFQGASGARWAIKCFTREVPGLQERYRAISKHLTQANLPFSVDFTYLPRGIRLRGQCYPILKMQWVDGLLVNEFVRKYLGKPERLEGLLQIWVRMGKRLRECGIAHGDLQHGNVILVPGRRTSTVGRKSSRALTLHLVDFDGMYVPALADKKPDEVGHPSYQHPQRILHGLYSPEADRLSLLLIACALRCLAVAGKPLWDRYDNGDNLLFQEPDLREPARSALFKELWNLDDAAGHDLVGYLALGLSLPFDQVPLLEALVGDTRTAALTGPQEEWVTRLLGPGAKIRRAGTRTPAGPGDGDWWKSWRGA